LPQAVEMALQQAFGVQTLQPVAQQGRVRSGPVVTSLAPASRAADGVLVRMRHHEEFDLVAAPAPQFLQETGQFLAVGDRHEVRMAPFEEGDGSFGRLRRLRFVAQGCEHGEQRGPFGR